MHRFVALYLCAHPAAAFAISAVKGSSSLIKPVGCLVSSSIAAVLKVNCLGCAEVDSTNSHDHGAPASSLRSANRRALPVAAPTHECEAFHLSEPVIGFRVSAQRQRHRSARMCQQPDMPPKAAEEFPVAIRNTSYHAPYVHGSNTTSAQLGTSMLSNQTGGGAPSAGTGQAGIAGDGSAGSDGSVGSGAPDVPMTEDAFEAALPPVGNALKQLDPRRVTVVARNYDSPTAGGSSRLQDSFVDLFRACTPYIRMHQARGSVRCETGDLRSLHVQALYAVRVPCACALRRTD
eukprot:6190404-Pleurochrysis_carterae.AAC.1